MSGEMNPCSLVDLRDLIRPSNPSQVVSAELISSHAKALLADRDYHFNRAEDAEEEAAQLLADLAETTAKLKAAQRELAALRGELIR